MNNYLLESLDSLAINREKEQIINKMEFKEASRSVYDMEEVSLNQALEDLDTYSFLSSKKIIEIRNIEVLKLDDYKEEFEHLYKYLDNPNNDNLLFIEAKKLNNTLKLTKDLKKKCHYLLCEVNLKEFIKECLKGYTINTITLNLLAEYCLDDIVKAKNECLKLKDACDNKTITLELVEELVVPKLGDSKELTFAFTRSLAEKNKKAALDMYNKLLNYNIDALSIVGLLASQIRIIYQVKVLEKRHLTNKEIANILGEKSDYRISKTKELTRFYSEEELLYLMQKLQEIDLKVKSQDIDPNFLIELFIMNM